MTVEMIGFDSWALQVGDIVKVRVFMASMYSVWLGVRVDL